MIKLIQFYVDTPLFGKLELVKVAQVTYDRLSPDIKQFIKELKPDTKNYVYAVAVPMGASEYYGPNNNGDWWSEEDLNPKEATAETGFRSFEQAKIYRSHINKDPNLAIGDIPKAAYNKELHRCEVIMQIDRNKAPDIARQIDNNEKTAVSMGARIKTGDICSVCGHVSRNRTEYCGHLRTKLGATLEDGRRVVAINPKPRFFDLSFVQAPAAAESAVLLKVASDQTVSSNLLAELMNYSESNISSQSSILKTASKLFDLLEPREERLPTDFIIKYSAKNFPGFLATSAALGIVLTPNEFQTAALTSIGNPELAKIMGSEYIIFTPKVYRKPVPFTLDSFNIKMAREMYPYITKRSAFEPFLSRRLANMNSAPEKYKFKEIENPLTDEVSALYNGYREKLATNLLSYEPLENLIEQYPELLCKFAETNIPFQKEAGLFDIQSLGTFIKLLLGIVPATFLLASYWRGQRDYNGMEMGRAQNFVANNPSTVAAVLFTGANKLINAKKG